MRRLLVVVSFGAALAAFGLTACGGGNDKPPLTPDTEIPAEAPEAGAATEPSSDTSATPLK
jgi:predicted small lipoprotein YifL